MAQTIEVMNIWLTDKLKNRVRQVFETRYKRSLTDDETVSIANSLVCFVETYSKAKWRQKYGNSKQQ